MSVGNALKLYDKYKDSGIEWIGEIPFDWNIRKIKYCCNLYTGNSISDDEKDNYILNENSIPYIATKDIDADTNSINYDNGLYIPLNNKDFKIAPSNSSLLCIEGGSAGRKIGFTDKDVCFVNKLCCFSSKENFNSKFLYYILQSDEFLTDFNLKMTGLIGGVSQIAIKNISVATTKIEEQNRITNYLDKKCGEVDRVVEVQKLIIEKLKEYKQSVITEAVTKGLDKNAPLKDSGIEWIGKIPQDWKVIRLKYKFKIKKEIAGKEGFNILSVTQKGIKIKDISTNEGQLAMDYSKYQLVLPTDFIMNHMDLLTGWIDCSIYSGVTSPDYRVFYNTDLQNCNNEYYKNIFQTCYRNKIFFGIGQGVSDLGRWRLQSDKFLNFCIPIPPYQEQEKINKAITEKCSEIDKAISEKEVLIEKLTQYKKSLIYECVTGKRRVSERHCEECK